MKTGVLIPFVMVALAAGALLFLRQDDGVPARPDADQEPRAGKVSPRDEASSSPERDAVRFADLAESNPKAAEAEAILLEGREREQAFEHLSAELAKKDPAKALPVAERISDPIRRGNSLGYALAQLAGTDPEAVYGWLETSDEEETVRAQAERMALPALAEGDPVRVANWIAEGKATPQGTDTAVVTTVQRWAQKDAHAAARWVTAFEDPRLLRVAMGPLVDLWFKQEADAARTWIDGLPAGPAKDEACAAYAITLAPISPDEAREWADRIAGPDLGRETVKRVEAAK